MKMKNAFVMAVIAMFLIGIAPFAAAHEDGNKGNKGDLEENARAEEIKEEAKARAEEIKEEAKARAEERLKEAKELRKAAKEEFKAQREALKEAREQLKNCKGIETPECNALREQALEKAQEMIKNGITRAIAALEAARERIAASDLPEEKKTELIAKLDERAAKLQAIADSAAGATSLEEIKSLVKEARKDVRKEVHRVKKHALALAGKNFGGILKKAGKLEGRVERAIARLKEKGADVSSVESVVNELKAKVEQARSLHNEAAAAFEARDMQTATQKLREAHSLLREAQQLFRQIVSGLKAVPNAASELQAAGKEVEAEPEPEVEEFEVEDLTPEEEKAAEAAEEVEEAAEEEAEKVAEAGEAERTA